MSGIALALRSELFSSSEILEISRFADSSPRISHLFFPDIPNGFESVELSTAALAVTRRIMAGSGVMRLLEHDQKLLLRRLASIQYLSKNRFVLGIGTGAAGLNPKETISKMLSSLDQLGQDFAARYESSTLKFPETFVAALGSKMAILAAGHSNGLLFNFCSPSYAQQVMSKVKENTTSPITFACYIKVFYASDMKRAEQLLIDEFSKYDGFPHYHRMFERDGVAGAISSTRKSGEIDKQLLRISYPNPSSEVLVSLVESYRKAGIALPCVYPYFDKNEKTDYKLTIIKQIAESAA